MYVCMYIGIHNIINTCLSALTVFDAASHFRSYCSDLASTLWFKRTACVYETKSHYASCPLSARFNPIYIYIYTYIYIHIYAYVYVYEHMFLYPSIYLSIYLWSLSIQARPAPAGRSTSRRGGLIPQPWRASPHAPGPRAPMCPPPAGRRAVDLYTILPLSLLYDVLHTQGGSGGGRILRIRRAQVLQ